MGDMVFTLLLLLAGLVGLVIASITDIKKKEVPDWLSYSLISIGLGTRLLYSLKTNLWDFFLYGVLGFLIMFLIGTLMYYGKQWGGGDAKLLMALGAIFATVPGKKFFLLNLGVNIFVVGAVYGIAFSIFLAFKHWSKFKQEFKKISENGRNSRFLICFIVLTIGIISLFLDEMFLKGVFILSTMGVLLSFYLRVFAKAVENTCMYKTVPSSKLVEGDWVANDIKIKGKVLYAKRNYGISKKQIGLLRKAKVREVLIKEGMPFVPVFLIATVLTLVQGSFFMGSFPFHEWLPFF